MSEVPTVSEEVEITFLQSDSCTVVQVEFAGLKVTGGSKRKPGDKQKKGVGIDLALGRAFLALGDALAARHGYQWDFVPTNQMRPLEESK